MKFIFNNSTKILLGLLIVIILFHICIIAKIIPYNIVWGGRLQNDSEMYVFETISVLVNLFLSWVLLIKSNATKFKFSNKAVTIILWIFFALFALNTLGNLLAKTYFEKCFAVLTGIFCLLLWNIIKQKNSD